MWSGRQRQAAHRQRETGIDGSQVSLMQQRAADQVWTERIKIRARMAEERKSGAAAAGGRACESRGESVLSKSNGN